MLQGENMRRIHRLALASLIMVSPTCFAASFDCAKASTPTEKTICADSVLSSLDTRLQQAYKDAMAAAAPSSKPTLVTEQRHWNRYVRDVCTDGTCLTRAYEARIAMLSTNDKYIADTSKCDIPEGKSCRSVITMRDTGARVDAFNKSLAENKKPGRVLGCDRLIDLPSGTSGGNHSYGALCTLQAGSARQRVRICNDEMVGHFALEPSTDDSAKALLEFTNRQCFGG
jgi:uncharacterized protein